MCLFGDALGLAKDLDANVVKLGQRLIELRDKSPDRFQALIEQSGLSGRKAYYLLRFAEGLANLKERGTGLDEDQLRRIGWTKLKVIATGLTPRNAAKRL